MLIADGIFGSAKIGKVASRRKVRLVGMGGSAPNFLEIFFCLKWIGLSTGETLEMPTMRKTRDRRRRGNPVREELYIYFVFWKI